MDLVYQQEKFTKLEISSAVDTLEEKGLLEAQFNRDVRKITNVGRAIALEYLQLYRTKA